MNTRLAKLSSLLVLVATAACGRAAAPAVTADAEPVSFERHVAVILAAEERTYGPEAQWEAVQTLEAMCDVDAPALAFPALEQACLDGRGQEVASLLGVYLKKVARGSESARARTARWMIDECGVQGWESRSERLGFVETAPEKFSLASEQRVIDSLLSDMEPQEEASLVAGR